MRNAALRTAARAQGLRHFTATCPTHGRGLHYTSSGRCMRCAAGAKNPARQAAYWADHAQEINQRRRERQEARK